MNPCELCGKVVERLAMQLEFAYYRRTAAGESSAEAIHAHHDCATRAYLELLDWKLDGPPSPALAQPPDVPACDVCKARVDAAEAAGMLVQLFADRSSELRLAAEFPLRGHPACLHGTFVRVACGNSARRA